MAEATCKDNCNDSDLKESASKSDTLECAVCLQSCVHPAQLPCGHIFCFLCVKGIANQSKKCALCRQEIPRDFIDQPNLLEKTQQTETSEGFDGGYQWFYEGRNGWWRYDPRTNEDVEQAFKLNLSEIQILICGELYVIDLVNYFQYPKKTPSRKRSIKRDRIENLNVKGWWQYDERTSKELESSYKKDERTCEFLIAGFLYIVDLENMLQLRRNDPSRRRKIKRDFATIPKKGIAGLRTDESVVESSSELRNIEVRNEDNLVPVTPSNTPQSPISGRESPREEHDLQATMERISSLQLNSAIGEIENADSSEQD